MGRFYDFKIHILVYTLEQMSRWAADQRRHVTFHIIGDGPERSHLDDLRVEHEFFHVDRFGVIESAALDGFLREKTDLVMSMGTSVLEGAKHGIPAVLLDYAFQPIVRPYRFRWLSDVQGDDLGHVMHDEDFDQRPESLARIMTALVTDNAGVSRRTLDYCRDHHGMDSVCGRFLDVVAQSSFRYGDTPPALTRKGLLRRVYERARYRHRPTAPAVTH